MGVVRWRDETRMLEDERDRYLTEREAVVCSWCGGSGLKVFGVVSGVGVVDDGGEEGARGEVKCRACGGTGRA